jgi:hypothetical protein
LFLSNINIDSAAPINPKIAPDAPKLIVFRGKRKIVNTLPRIPEMKYIKTNLYFEKLSSIYDPKINRENIFEKR